MICKKCGSLFSPTEFHTEGFDPEKCWDCQPMPNSPDIEPETEICPVECYSEEYDLGGEA